MSQKYTLLSPPNSRGLVGPRVDSDLCLRTQFRMLWDCVRLSSGVCPLVGEAGLETCGGFLVGGPWIWVLAQWWAGLCQGVSRGGCELRESLGRLPVVGWDCVHAPLVVCPEVSQHWSL